MNCLSCGKTIPDNSRFCVHCGALVTMAADAEAKQPTPPSGSAEAPTLAPPDTPPEAREAPKKKLVGRGFSAIGALLVLAFFFTPWVQACGATYSGAELLTEPMIEGREFYALAPLAALICGGALLLTRRSVPGVRRAVARWNLLVAAIGSLPVWNLLANVVAGPARGAGQTEYGLWGTLAGLIGMATGSVMEVKESQKAATPALPASVFCSACGTENPADHLHCRECGAGLLAKQQAIEAKPQAADTVRVLHILTAVGACLLAALLILSGLVGNSVPELSYQFTPGLSVMFIAIGLLLIGATAMSFRLGNSK